MSSADPHPTNAPLTENSGSDNVNGLEEKLSTIKMACDEGTVVSPLEWGIPGKLTKTEEEVYYKFRDVVESRGGDFRMTVYSFGEEEGEPYTLCRWLRARKFDFDLVIKMVEEATEVRSAPLKENFYPDPELALKVERHVYISQYPQLYYGNGKNGIPVFYSMPGRINVNGMHTITSLQSVIKYHWYEMIHNFGSRLRDNKRELSDFTSFSCITVLDLDQLSASAMGSRTMSIINEQAKIDSLCFPETMHKMIIVNAPRFFAMSWKIIKGWLDVRTANKIEIISSKKNMHIRLKEIIDEDKLPSDYGGTAPSTEALLASNAPGNMKKTKTELLSVRTHASYVFDLIDDEKADVVIYTKAKAGAKFSITKGNKKEVVVSGVDITFVGGGDDPDLEPTMKVVLAKDIIGPGKYKVKAESNAKSMSRVSYDNFLVVANIYAI